MPRMECLDLGATPANEPCTPVGADNYFTKARAECHRYIELLTKKFGKPPGKAYFVVVSNPHDFGSYLDVAIKFDANSQTETTYAYTVESNLPGNWNDETPVRMMVYEEK